MQILSCLACAVAYNGGMTVLDILRAIFEILVLWVLIYQLWRVVKGSRGGAILAGLLALVVVCYFVLEITEARVLQKIATLILSPGVVVVVLFQPEIRNALAKLGANRLFMPLFRRRSEKQDFIAKVVDSVHYLASKHFGALICICRTNKLTEYAQTATQIDAEYSRELIGTIFFPKTLLHDGAVIVEDERIVCAGAILPVSNKELADRSLGLRHRAGIGMAESSDAVVIIVSEETGTISLAVGGTLQRDVSDTLLTERLTELLNSHANTEDNSNVVEA